jgi:hypothetical protein
MRLYLNAIEAIRDASHSVECGVCYQSGKGWTTYDPTKGCPEGFYPEFLCFPGRLPLPLHEIAIDVLVSIIREKLL